MSHDMNQALAIRQDFGGTITAHQSPLGGVWVALRFPLIES